MFFVNIIETKDELLKMLQIILYLLFAVSLYPILIKIYKCIY